MTQTTVTSDFKAFKRRIIAESLTAPSNTLFSLSKQHIEVVLGIPMPMLMESVDRKLQKRVLHEQFIYEQFLKNLGQAAKGLFQRATRPVQGQVQRAGAAWKAFKHSGAKGIKHAFETTIKGPVDLIKFLGIVVREPAYLKLFWLKLKEKLADVRQKITGYFQKLGERLGEEAKTDKLTSTIMSGWEKLKSFMQKVDSMSGWKQAMLGLGLFILISYILHETGGVEALEAALEKAGESIKHTAQHAVHDIGHTAHSAEVGFHGAEGAIHAGEETGRATAAAAGGAARVLGTLLGGELVKKLASSLNDLAIAALGGLFTAGVWTAIQTIIKVAGTFVFVATVIHPITDPIVELYNKNKKNGISGAQSAWFAQGDEASKQAAAQQPQMAEHRIKLAHILF